jgi:hypothetical protein
MLDLGPRSRVAFAALWLAGQAALVITAGRRADASFGFRMFSESSTIAVALSRVVEAPSGHGTVSAKVADGAWSARDRDGTLHRIRWRDRVLEPELGTFDVTMHASYGEAAQLERLRAALDDVATHTPEDAETRALVLDVTVRKNGGEPRVIHVERARALEPAATR